MVLYKSTIFREACYLQTEYKSGLDDFNILTTAKPIGSIS